MKRRLPNKVCEKTFQARFMRINNSCNLACGFCAFFLAPENLHAPGSFERGGPGRRTAASSSCTCWGAVMHPRLPEILAACSAWGQVNRQAPCWKFGPGLFKEKCLTRFRSLQALGELPAALRAKTWSRILAFSLKPPGLIVTSACAGTRPLRS